MDEVMIIAELNNINGDIDNALLSHYLQNAQDIRGCPA
jgi:hypothetical protein